jgi:toxin YoeB
MVRRKIIWSHRARIRLLEILELYNDRNQSKAFSIKLYREIKKHLSLIAKQPEIGIKTELSSFGDLFLFSFWLNTPTLGSVPLSPCALAF